MSARDKLAQREMAELAAAQNEVPRGDWKAVATKDVALVNRRSYDRTEQRDRVERELAIVNSWMARFPRDEILGRVRSMPYETWMQAPPEQRGAILHDIEILEQELKTRPAITVTFQR